MASVANFEDAYGSGAPCFLYNILAMRRTGLSLPQKSPSIRHAWQAKR
jgi:hypothetical protein